MRSAFFFLMATLAAGSAIAGVPVDAPGETKLASPTKTKLELRQGLPTVSVTIDGHGPYAFLVDTDANVLAVSERVTRDTNLTRGEKDAMGNTTVAIRELKLGDARFLSMTAAMEILKSFVITIDQQKRQITFSKATAPSRVDGGR